MKLFALTLATTAAAVSGVTAATPDVAEKRRLLGELFRQAQASSLKAAAAAALPSSLPSSLLRRNLQMGPPPGDGDDAGVSLDTCAFDATPCSAELLGDVGATTVSGDDPASGTLSAGENIYGPFEAGFSSDQQDILLQLGCTSDNVETAYVAGGIDTATAAHMINYGCALDMPYTDSQGVYRDLLDECGGHTTEYQCVAHV